MTSQTCLFILIALPAVLLQQATDVFLKHGNAHNILRAKRANSGFEEFKKGNLERECYEEPCSFEEAREVFEEEDKTREFWSKYFDGDQCNSNLCQNGGSCKDGINEYNCFCNAGFEGKHCETVIPQLCSLSNGECDQFCKAVNSDIVCSCTTGYVLGEDGKSCFPTEKYSCGKRHMKREKRAAEVYKDDKESHTDIQDKNYTGEAILDTDEPNVRLVGERHCQYGECPWQVLLIDEENEGFCGGTILSQDFILTAAQCIDQTRSFKVAVGVLNRLKSYGTESVHKVERTFVHPRFVNITYDYDIAVIKLKEAINFTENIIPACIPEPEFANQVLLNEPDAMVSGFGRIQERGRRSSVELQMLQVPYIKRHRCKESSTFAITDNMFCAGFDKEVKYACQGDRGGPHVTPFRGTYFVTGIVSWDEGCARKGKFGVYTTVSKFYRWLKAVMKKLS